MKYYLFASAVYLTASVIVLPLALICGIVSIFGSAREFLRGVNAGLSEYKEEINDNSQSKQQLLDELRTSTDAPLDIWDRHIARMEQKNKSEGK